MAKHALLAVNTDVTHDPRVRRQIDWLTSEGWVVDTLGLGEHPSDQVRDHFALAPIPRFLKTFVGAGLTHTLVPYKRRFGMLIQDRFPAEAKRRVREGEYDLVLVSDYHFVPWFGDPATFPPGRRVAHVHLDLHEWFPPALPTYVRGYQIMRPYHRWIRSFFQHPVIDTRSVAGATAGFYVEEFGFDEPILVRNMPPREDLDPSPVDPQRIELIHHGLASWIRGFREMVDAMPLVDDRFVLTFMLNGPAEMIDELRAYVEPQKDRIRIVPPVPMRELAKSINPYDVEVMFFPPVTENLMWTLPNKLYEAIQGRLALVTGPTLLMAQAVVEFGNGVVTEGWEPAQLAAAINGLTAERIVEMKKASDAAAAIANAEEEKYTFFRSIGFPLEDPAA
jgi:glycosyltransferase involved in cell wall biosynthesis